MQQADTSYDLVTPDGRLNRFLGHDPYIAQVHIQGISPHFRGFYGVPVEFNLKSTLAQLGIEAHMLCLDLDPHSKTATIEVTLTALSPWGTELLKLLAADPISGAAIGKLFAADPSRLLTSRDQLDDYLSGYNDKGEPLLQLPNIPNLPSAHLQIAQHQRRLVAHLPLFPGTVSYEPTIESLLPTLARALAAGHSVRNLLPLHQKLNPKQPRLPLPGQILLLKSSPLYVTGCFARVATDLLPPGVHHTSARILQPTTRASGDIYECYSLTTTSEEITQIPLEFYTLEPQRRHQRLSPSQVTTLSHTPWQEKPLAEDEPPAFFLVEEGLSSSYTLHECLRQLNAGEVSSEGVLRCYYLPPATHKGDLLTSETRSKIKAVSFNLPSASDPHCFSYEEQGLLGDLWRAGIRCFWHDSTSKQVLEYIQKPARPSGLFVPIERCEEYLHATTIGFYGSNQLHDGYEDKLQELLNGLIHLRQGAQHALLNPGRPLAVVTGGGPGMMAVGNKVARDLGLLSCGHLMDFEHPLSAGLNAQHNNTDIDAKMSYQLSSLIERQAHFDIDLPIFVPGGIGTDFELSLELVRRKTLAMPPTPILLMGEQGYWHDKITVPFQRNQQTGTIQGSEWISSCLYLASDAQSALRVYQRLVEGTLPIGPGHLPHPEGFIDARTL